MKKIVFLTLSALVMLSVSAFSQAKIAFVNSGRILEQLPEAQQAQKDLQTQLKVWQDELERIRQQYQTEAEDYQKKQAMMDPAAKAAKEQALQDLQSRFAQYQQEKFDTREGEAVKLQAQKLQPIQQRVLDAIQAVAKEEGFNFVFDKVSEATLLLYADETFNLTHKVLDRLTRGAATKGKK